MKFVHYLNLWLVVTFEIIFGQLWQAKLCFWHILFQFSIIQSVVFVHDRHSGRQLYRLPFDFGSLRSVFAKPDESEIFLTFESYLNPTTIWYGDFRECTGTNSEDPIKLSIFHQQKVPASFKRDNFLEKQIFAWNDDGTRVLPMIFAIVEELKFFVNRT